MAMAVAAAAASSASASSTTATQVGQNEFETLLAQVPSDWKKPVLELCGSLGSMYSRLTGYNKTIEAVSDVSHHLTTAAPPPTSQLPTPDLKLIDKCKNFTKGLANQVKDFCGMSNKDGCPDFEKAWEEARQALLAELDKEKMRAANNCVKIHAITSALVLLVEAQGIYAVWVDIDKAENVLKNIRDTEFPKIHEERAKVERIANQLKELLAQFAAGGGGGEGRLAEDNNELLRKIREVTFLLMLDLSELRSMISDVKFIITNEVVCIGQHRDEQFRHGLTNTAQGLGNAIQYQHLAANLSNPYKMVSISISVLFGIMAALNFYNYGITKDKLKELQQAMCIVAGLERFVRDKLRLVEQSQLFTGRMSMGASSGNSAGSGDAAIAAAGTVRVQEQASVPELATE